MMGKAAHHPVHGWTAEHIGDGEIQGDGTLECTDHPSTMVNHGIGGELRVDHGEANCDNMANEGSSSIALGLSDGAGELAEIQEVENMAKKTIYVCEGSCHGVASEEQWKAGATTCGAKGCELHGKPLKRKEV